MEKYNLTIQHEYQKVAYIEFRAENDSIALSVANGLLNEYKAKDSFIPRYPMSGNFSGVKPPIKSYHVSKWVNNPNSVNAWGMPCGGYWSQSAMKNQEY